MLTPADNDLVGRRIGQRRGATRAATGPKGGIRRDRCRRHTSWPTVLFFALPFRPLAIAVNPARMRRMQTASLFDLVERQDPSAAQVHSLQTSDTSLAAWTFRNKVVVPHKAFLAKMERVADLIGDEYGRKHFIRQSSCRSHAWIVQNKTSLELRVASSRCNLRWCPMCINTRRLVITGNLAPWIRRLHHPKFLTFTLKHSSEPLDDQVQRLYDCFRKIRRRKFLSSKLRGGVWFFQVTYNEEKNEWHPHIHVVADSAYIPKRRLSSLWKEITGDSFITDIRKIADPDEAADYAARYATAPANPMQTPDHKTAELVIAMRDRRICGAFGTARCVRLSPQKPDDIDDWKPVGSYMAINFRARFDPLCDHIMRCLHRRVTPFSPLWSDPQDDPAPPPEIFDLEPEPPRQYTFTDDWSSWISG